MKFILLNTNRDPYTYRKRFKLEYYLKVCHRSKKLTHHAGIHLDFCLIKDLKYHSRLSKTLKLKENVLRTCHNDMGGGHLGFKKTWPKIRDNFMV